MNGNVTATGWVDEVWKMDDWRQIDTAPRDGTIIEVMDPDCGRFAMRWNPAGHNPIFQKDYGNGIWECPGNNFTWSEDDGYGPRYWRALPDTHVTGISRDCAP